MLRETGAKMPIFFPELLSLNWGFCWLDELAQSKTGPKQKSKMKLPTSAMCFLFRWADSSKSQSPNQAASRMTNSVTPPPILSKKSSPSIWPIPNLSSKYTKLVSSISVPHTWTNSFTVIRRQFNPYSAFAPCTTVREQQVRMFTKFFWSPPNSRAECTGFHTLKQPAKEAVWKSHICS